MTIFYNLARMYTETTGDSDVTLTTAVPGCLTFALAGVSDSEEVNYGLITYDLITHRPTGSETGLGKYISSGTTFQRTTVEKSTDSDNSAIALTGLTEIYLTPPASKYNSGFNSASSYYYSTTETISDSGTGILLSIDTEYADPDGISSISTNKVKFSRGGLYYISCAVFVGADNGTTPLNGHVNATVKVNATSAFNKTYGFATAENIIDGDFAIGPFTYLLADSDEVSVTIDNHLGQDMYAGIGDFSFIRIGSTT